MLIPVFTIYANKLTNATPMLIGLALGCYGLTQSILQIPFGMLSDKYGRKPIITIGLILFTIGSLIGAYTHSIEGMILARSLQGAGAIGSVLIALLTDLTPDAKRTQAMAIVGSTIGMSFSLAIVISPYITKAFGLSGIFSITAILSIIGLLIIHTVIPTPKKIDVNTNRIKFKEVFCNKHLMRLNVGIFFQHLILTATFFAVPMLLQEQIKLGKLTALWHFYLPLVIVSFIAMVPCIIFAEKKRKIKLVFNLSVSLILLTQACLIFTSGSLLNIGICLFVFFVGFNILEANLPSIVSKQANIENRGSAMGIYSSFQFLGIFVGGSLSGIIFHWHSYAGIFILNTIISLIWLYISSSMQPLQYQLVISIPYSKNITDKDGIINQLGSLDGVCHVTVSNQDNTVYLRVEKALYKDGSAEKILQIYK